MQNYLYYVIINIIIIYILWKTYFMNYGRHSDSQIVHYNEAMHYYSILY